MADVGKENIPPSSTSSPHKNGEQSTVTRKRPLRTYGKRKTQDQDADLPQKKRRKTDDKDLLGSVDTPKHPVTQIQTVPTPMPSSSPRPSPKRSGIMRYFRPAPQPTTPVLPSSDTVTPSSPRQSECIEPSSTPPSSPPPLLDSSRRRKKRRLTTRLRSTSLSPEKKPLRSPTIEADDRDKGENTEAEDLDTTRYSRLGTRGNIYALRDFVNQVPAPQRGKTTKSGSGRQMTLSLGKAGTTSFVECSVCDMLYNKLEETDVKLHARRHAAVLRAGAKTGRVKTV